MSNLLAIAIGQIDEAIAYLRGKPQEWDRLVAAHIAKCDNHRHGSHILYLDQTGGLDTNQGLSEETAFKTLLALVRYVPTNDNIIVKIVGDYDFNIGGSVEIASSFTFEGVMVGSTKPVLTLGVGWIEGEETIITDPDYVGGRLQRFGTLEAIRVMPTASSPTIIFKDVVIQFPSRVGLETNVGGIIDSIHHNDASLVMQLDEGSYNSSTTLVLDGVVLLHPNGSYGSIVSRNNQVLNLTVTNTTFNTTDMAGNWVSEVPAGTAPTDVAYVTSNLGSL